MRAKAHTKKKTLFVVKQRKRKIRRKKRKKCNSLKNVPRQQAVVNTHYTTTKQVFLSFTTHSFHKGKKKQKKVAYTSDENFNVAFNKNKQTTTTKKKAKKKRSSAVLHFVIQNNTHVHSLYCFVDYPLFFFSFHQPLFVSHLR